MIAAIAAISALSGCRTETENAEAEDTCNAAAYQSLIGQNRAAADPLPDPKRVYRLGDPVTMDFNPKRLNVKLDTSDVIAEIDCG